MTHVTPLHTLKYYIPLFFFASIFLNHRATGQLVVSDPISIAEQSLWGNMRPRVALNGDGEPVAIWTNPSDKSVYTSYRSNGVFSVPLRLNPSDIELSVFDWSGPEIASYGNNLYVVFKQIPEHNSPIFCVHSNDGGVSWSDTVRVDSSFPLMSRMPTVSAGPNGVYVGFMRENMETMFSEWAVSRSDDYGNTFGEAVSATVGITDAVCDCCPASMVNSNSTVAFLYRNNEENLRDIRTSISLDNGTNFEQYVDMDDQDWVIAACPSTGPQALFVEDQIKSIWMSDATGDSRIYFSQYNLDNPTAVTSSLIHSAPVNETQNFPTLSGDGNILGAACEVIISGQRNIAFMWGNNNFEQTQYEILTEVDEGNQQRPSLAFDGDMFHLVYTDNGMDAVVYRTITLFNDVEEPSGLNTSLHAFPNPTADICTIQWVQSQSASVHVEIFDALGELRSTQNVVGIAGQNNFDLDLSMLASNMFSVRLRSIDQSSSLRIVKLD